VAVIRALNPTKYLIKTAYTLYSATGTLIHHVLLYDFFWNISTINFPNSPTNNDFYSKVWFNAQEPLDRGSLAAQTACLGS
jgi:hypothetical protein